MKKLADKLTTLYLHKLVMSTHYQKALRNRGRNLYQGNTNEDRQEKSTIFIHSDLDSLPTDWQPDRKR